MMEAIIPLSGFAGSPFSRPATRCGKGDTAFAAGRPLPGCPRPERAGFVRSVRNK